ncbi:methyltransferase domain-containing protein [Pelagophyceae sp. CCMP2097]|nr:methyltransferase domain-containing protein [Pelagophyceae sp. CCMP2097]
MWCRTLRHVVYICVGVVVRSECDLRLRSVFGAEQTDRAIARYESWLEPRRRLTAGGGANSTATGPPPAAVAASDWRADEGRRLAARTGPRKKHKPMPWVEIVPGSFLRQTPILSSVPLLSLCPAAALASIGEAHEAKKFCGVEALREPNCTIISVGCNGQWQFETEVLAQTNCRVETFDCTGEWTVPANLAARVTLHPICLGAQDERRLARRFMTWASAMRHVSATRVDWLKIDCEGCEHTVLRQMLQSTTQVPLPEQVSVEVHFGTADLFTRPTRPLRDLFPSGQDLFAQLYAFGGYFLISRLDLRAAYPAASGCSELVFARAACATRALSPRPALALFDPAVDWLDAAQSPCVDDSGHAPWLCPPWSSNRPKCQQRAGNWAACPSHQRPK